LARPTRRLSSFRLRSATGISVSIAAAVARIAVRRTARCSALRARWNVVTLTFYRPSVCCYRTSGLIASYS
jgi:hypothetical protein